VITIPNRVLQAARESGVKSVAVSIWLNTLLVSSGIAPDASPADWPEDIWQAYKRLREAVEPGSTGGSAKHLLDTLPE